MVDDAVESNLRETQEKILHTRVKIKHFARQHDVLRESCFLLFFAVYEVKEK